MTKSTSRSQVRLIASTNAIFGADEACAMLRISRDAMYRLAKDPDDPFPIRYIGGKTRDGIVKAPCLHQRHDGNLDLVGRHAVKNLLGF